MLTGINPTKDAQHLCTGNCETLLKLKKTQLSRELDHVQGSEGSVAMMLIIPRVVNMPCNPNQIPSRVFGETVKPIPEFKWKQKRPRRGKNKKEPSSRTHPI